MLMASQARWILPPRFLLCRDPSGAHHQYDPHSSTDHHLSSQQVNHSTDNKAPNNKEDKMTPKLVAFHVLLTKSPLKLAQQKPLLAALALATGGEFDFLHNPHAKEAIVHVW